MILLAAINWHSFFFLCFALLTCVFAVAVVLTANVVRMAFYLVLSLGATAGLFFLAGADLNDFLKIQTPAEAEATGECLAGLVITEESSGLGGRCIVTLTKQDRTRPLPFLP